MANLLQSMGGRKFTLLLVGLILIVLKDVIGIDDEAIDKILYLALGGSGVIAVNDVAKTVTNGKTPIPKPKK